MKVNLSWDDRQYLFVASGHDDHDVPAELLRKLKRVQRKLDEVEQEIVDHLLATHQKPPYGS